MIPFGDDFDVAHVGNIEHQRATIYVARKGTVWTLGKDVGAVGPKPVSNWAGSRGGGGSASPSRVPGYHQRINRPSPKPPKPASSW